MNLPAITITGGALSDIFFNFDHTAVREAYAAAEDGLSNEDHLAALTADAKDFCALIGEPELAQDLIDDYMARR